MATMIDRCSWCGVPIAEHPYTDACAIAQEASASIRDEVAAALHDARNQSSCRSRAAASNDVARLIHIATTDEPKADAFLAALAARGLTVVREGELDVERLARAMRNTTAHLSSDWTHPGNAAAIAAEYARLTRQPEGQ